MNSASPRRLCLVSGRSHPELAAKVAAELGVDLCTVRLGNFANGEIGCQLEESVRGADVFVMQTHAAPVNDAIFEQALMIDAARRASAASITAVCPFMGYARQDRKASGREPIAARLVVDFLADAGADRIMTVDLHSGQIQGFFKGPFDHLIAMPLLRDYVRDNLPKNVVIVSPDAGLGRFAGRHIGRTAAAAGYDGHFLGMPAQRRTDLPRSAGDQRRGYVVLAGREYTDFVSL